LALTAKPNNRHLGLCPLAMKRNTAKQLCVSLTVDELPTALLASGTSRVVKSKTRTVRSTQYQLRLFKT